MTRIVALLLALAAAGCSGGGENASPATTGPGLQALLVGRLFGDAARRCVWVGRPRTGTQVAWPRRYRIRFDPVRVENRSGRILARRGDWVRMGGGVVDNLRPKANCPGADQPGRWLPSGKIDFLGRARPPEAP